MRLSPHRHTLAVLRTTLGLTQKEMADLVECSRPTIQAVELGKLPLSEKLAKRIEHETGIGLEWLLANDPATPPTDGFGRPYTKKTFDQYQASQHRRSSDPNDFYYMQGTVAFALMEISNMVLASYKAGRLDLCGFKLKQALLELRKELGVGEDYVLKSGREMVDSVLDNTIDLAEARLLNKPSKTPRLLHLSKLVDEFEHEFYKLYQSKSKPRTP